MWRGRCFTFWIRSTRLDPDYHGVLARKEVSTIVLVILRYQNLVSFLLFRSYTELKAQECLKWNLLNLKFLFEKKCRVWEPLCKWLPKNLFYNFLMFHIISIYYLTCCAANFQRFSSNSKFGMLVFNGQCELFWPI